MPNTGDTFTTVLKKAHLEWGTYRHTSTRGLVYGEAYLQIPADVARNLLIYNNNQTGANTDYFCVSRDDFLENVRLKASGCSTAGDVYAKQFHGSGNLKVLGDWFHYIDASIGDRIKITWTSPIDIEVEKL